MKSIDSWDDFVNATALDGVLFRGQTRDYMDIVPSLFRQNLPTDYDQIGSAAAKLYLDAYSAEEEHAAIVKADQPIQLSDEELGPFGTPPVPFLGHGFGSIGDYDEYGPMIDRFTGKGDEYRHAVLQHYGAPTPVLDVTYNPRIALWFATHQFRSGGGDLARYYEHTELGFVYILKASIEDTIDLRGGRLVPSAGLRGHRQEGGLLRGATQAAPTLTHLVVETLQIGPGVFAPTNQELAKYTQEYLFPPPEQDPFFKALLNARFSLDAAQQELGRHFLVYI